MNFDNLILNDNHRALSVYPVSFDLALLTLTVFTWLYLAQFIEWMDLKTNQLKQWVRSVKSQTWKSWLMKKEERNQKVKLI